MKKFCLICIILFFLACSNNKAPKGDTNNLEEIENFKEDFKVEKEGFQYESFISQKLQDYYDLKMLKESYPEFNDEINQQLKNLSSDTTSTSKILIKDIYLIDEPQAISDSIKNFNIGYDLVSNGLVSKDSILAILHTKEVNIDNQKFISTSIKFIKN